MRRRRSRVVPARTEDPSVNHGIRARRVLVVDQEGNRLASHLSATHSHDAANRLLGDDDYCYAYDANGNLTTRTARILDICDGPATSYRWDVQNRLIGFTGFDGGTASYRYDADGRRIEKAVDGRITRYVYDGDASLVVQPIFRQKTSKSSLDCFHFFFWTEYPNLPLENLSHKRSMVAKSVLGIFLTSVKYTKLRPFALAPEISIKASRVNC